MPHWWAWELHKQRWQSSSSPGTALTAVTSLARGDSRLSALVNSPSCEGQELMYNEAWQWWRARRGSGVNSGHSVMSAASRWGFNSNRGGNPSTDPLIPGPGLAIDTHQSMDAKQISISQYSLPRPTSWHSHPKCSHVYLTSSWNNRDNSIVFMMGHACTEF